MDGEKSVKYSIGRVCWSPIAFCHIAIATAITFFICFGAFAENGEGILAKESKDICSKGGQSEMNICMAKEYKKIDVKMNDLYAQLISTLKKPEGIEDTQEAWIKYRDAECSIKVFQLSEGGSLLPYAKFSCLIDFTQERIKHLQWHLAQNCNGCPPRK